MKSLLILLIAVLATQTSFAQKAKVKDQMSAKSVIQVQYSCPMHPEVVSTKAGKCPSCNMDLAASKKEQMKREVSGAYMCPMHRDEKSDQPGTCSKCKKTMVTSKTGDKKAQATYSCSMHPEVKSDVAKKCPHCNMTLKNMNKGTNIKKG